jgi:hypothetical protein
MKKNEDFSQEFDFAKDTVKQIIFLSSALIGFTFPFFINLDIKGCFCAIYLLDLLQKSESKKEMREISSVKCSYPL